MCVVTLGVCLRTLVVTQLVRAFENARTPPSRSGGHAATASVPAATPLKSLDLAVFLQTTVCHANAARGRVRAGITFAFPSATAARWLRERSATLKEEPCRALFSVA